MAAEIENSPSNSQGSSTHPVNLNQNQIPSSTLPSFPQSEKEAMDTDATAPPQDDTKITHSHQFFTADEIAKYNKYEADYASYLRAKYFSDKDVYGGDIYDLTVKVGNETIKASRSSPTRSFAEPAQSVVDPGHVLASEVELPAPGAEPSQIIANGSITPVVPISSNEMKRTDDMGDSSDSLVKEHQAVGDHIGWTNMETWSTLFDLETLINLVDDLSGDKKKIIDELGFGCLLKFNCKNLRKTMCKWVIDHFDPESQILEIDGKTTKINPTHVEYLLGFKNDGFDIKDEVLQKTEPSEPFTKEFLSLLHQDTRSFADELRNMKHDDTDFQKVFTLFFMTSFAAPTADKRPRNTWLHLVLRNEMFGRWNWAKFILDNTVAAVKEFKATSANELGGCPLFFMAVFCEYSSKSGLDDIWKYNLPRIDDWNDNNTEKLHYIVVSYPLHYKTPELMMKIEAKKTWIIQKVEYMETRLSVFENKLFAFEENANKIERYTRFERNV